MDGPADPALNERLIEHGNWLRARIERRAGWLLRVDGVEDLLQDIQLRALKAADDFEYQGEGQLKAWLDRLVGQHLADRHRYWNAGRRNAGHMLRVSAVGSPSTITGGRGVDPTADGPGPMTWAEARDQHAFAVRAINALLPRDQQIVEWLREGRSDADLAESLGVTAEAAARARLRAIERFRRAYELLVRSTA